jgi:transcriptional regulator with XRE-family HTH domain
MVKNLKILRISAGLSQKQLADVINVSQQSINKYENHEVEPNIETLISIAKLFNTSVDYLIGATDVKRKIELVQQYDLNSEEKELIDLYRTTDEEDKYLIVKIMQRLRKRKII